MSDWVPGVLAGLFLLMPGAGLAEPTSDEFFRPYGAGYVGALAACVRYLESDGDLAVLEEWEEISPPKPVCIEASACQSLSKPGKAWTVVHVGRHDARAFCFGAWTRRVIVGSGEVIAAMNEFSIAAVAAKRLVPIPPQPDWIVGPNFSIASVFRNTAPPLDELESYLGCSATGRPFVVSLHLRSDLFARFEAQLLDNRMLAQWRDMAPCVGLTS